MNISDRKLSQSNQKCSSWREVPNYTQQRIRVVYVTRTITSWRHRLHMQTDNNGTCSNLVAYTGLLINLLT